MLNIKAGWDTHGLPIELAVEQSLELRRDIGKYPLMNTTYAVKGNEIQRGRR